MRLLRKIRELSSRLRSAPGLDKTFIFPYSSDKYEKRSQVWDNLQKGLLLEEKQMLIPWETPFNQLNNYKEKRRDSADRTEWYLGKHKILDGYESQLEAMMWMYLPWTNPMTAISENIGTDVYGNKHFIELKEKLTDLLGDPSTIDLEKFGSFDLGEIQWTNGRVRISLVGIEQFNCRYSLRIGLIHDENEAYLNEFVENLNGSELAGRRR